MEKRKTQKTSKDTNQLPMKIAASKITIRDEDFKSLYMNHVQLGFTRFDFQMVLGSIEVSSAKEYQNLVKETACVRMSPGYAKALAQDLTATLAKYEQSYGEIQLPRGLDDPLDARR